MSIMDFSWAPRLYYGRILFVTKPTLTTYLKRYLPARISLNPEKFLVNARNFLDTLRVYILDLVNNFVDHQYHSANPATYKYENSLIYISSTFIMWNDMERSVSRAITSISMARILWVPLTLFKRYQKKLGLMSLEGYVWILLKLRAYVKPISYGASFSWVWDRRTNYLQEHKPVPERLKVKRSARRE